MEPTGQIYTDQTGRFVTPCSNGNNYLMVLYDYDSNHIFAQPFRNRTANCILNAFKILHKRLCLAGCRPKLHRLDNECSTILKEFLTEENIKYQLVPPLVHHRNSAERAIRTFANHFIAGLCSVDKDFPIHLWDHLVPQAEISLNLLRSSRINPKLSAHAQINGQFDYNATPLGPPGCRVLAHAKPSDRTTWSPHAGLDGWYAGPAMESYRCWRIWIFETRAIRTCDTVSWFPSKVQMPESSTNDLILAALMDIAKALKYPSPRSPLALLTDANKSALQALVELMTTRMQADNNAPVELPVPSLRVAETPPPLQVTPNTPPAPILRVPNDSPAESTSSPNIIPPDEPAPPRAEPLVDCGVPTPPANLAPPTNAGPHSPTRPPTYAEVTGPTGNKNRRAKRQTDKATKEKRRNPAPVPPLPDAKAPSRRSKRKPKPKRHAFGARQLPATFSSA